MVWFVALLGLLVGVGLNHLTDRLTERQRLALALAGADCTGHGTPVTWFSILWYVLGRSRCTRCGNPLPLRRPILELATAVAFGSLFQARGWSVEWLLDAFYYCVFAVVLVTDLEYRLILNAVVIPGIAVALVGSFHPTPPTPLSALVGMAFGFGFFLLIAAIRPGGMGAGDIKLAAFIGAVTGFPNVVTALLIGIFTGGFVALFLVVARIKSLKSYIPYGPFLVFGGALVAFFGPIIRQWWGVP